MSLTKLHNYLLDKNLTSTSLSQFQDSTQLIFTHGKRLGFVTSSELTRKLSLQLPVGFSKVLLEIAKLITQVSDVEEWSQKTMKIIQDEMETNEEFSNVENSLVANYSKEETVDLIQPKLENNSSSQPQVQTISNKAQLEKLTICFQCHHNVAFQEMKNVESELRANFLESTKLVVKHQQELKRKGYLKQLFGTIQVSHKPAKHETVLFRDSLTHNILPPEISVKFIGNDTNRVIENISLGNIDQFEIVSVRIDNLSLDNSNKLHVKDKSNIFIFTNYFRWAFNNERRISSMIYLREDVIENGLDEVKQKMIGMDHHIDEMKAHVKLLTSNHIPRGFIFWGPPGTGKTTVVKHLCDEWTIKQVCTSLASGDFKQGLQGDSEKMIRHLGERASAVPWMMCSVAIDEIDALAQSRSGTGGEKGDVNVLSVLLSMIGGMNDVPNLVFFGSTNLFHMMDEAFLRRMDAKFFIGKPSFSAREKWIQKFEDKIKISPEKRDETIKLMKIMTINFSHDAMKKLLQLTSVNRVFDYGNKPLTIEEIIPYISTICRMYSISFGTYRVTELSSGITIMKNHPNRKVLLKKFWSVSKTLKNNLISSKYTGRIWIDMRPIYGGIQLEYSTLVCDLSSSEMNILNRACEDDDTSTLRSIEKTIKPEMKTLIDILERKKMTYWIPQAKSILKILEKEEFSLTPLQLTELMNNTSKQKMFRQKILDDLECSKFIKEFYLKKPMDKTFLVCPMKSMRIHTGVIINEIKSHILRQFYTETNEKKVEFIGTGTAESLTFQEVIQTLLGFGVKCNMDAMYLLDANTLYSNHLTSESQIIAYIQSIIDECDEYNKSMIIFDLDSIAEVSKEFSGLKEEETKSDFMSPSFSYRMLRNEVILRIFRLLNSVNQSSKTPRIWYTVLSSDSFVINLFKDKCNWPECQEEKKTDRMIQMKKQKPTLTCVNCGQSFTQDENENDSCCYHKGTKLYRDSEKRIIEECLSNKIKEDSELFKGDEQKLLERLKTLRTSFELKIPLYEKSTVESDLINSTNFFNITDLKWACCGRGYYDSGEVVCSHESDK